MTGRDTLRNNQLDSANIAADIQNVGFTLISIKETAHS